MRRVMLRGLLTRKLRSAVDDYGQSVVMVTHDQHAASYADRRIVLVDGRIVEDA